MTADPNHQLNELLTGLGTLDRNAIDGLLAVEKQGVHGFLRKQIQKFISKAPDNLDQFHIEIEKTEFNAARETIHKLAGYAGMIGAKSIRELGLKIESAIDGGSTDEAVTMSKDLRGLWVTTVNDLELLLARLPAS